MALTFCEPSHATERSPVHVRETGVEGEKPGGGIQGVPLCGRDLRKGWDLRAATRDEIEGWLAEMEKPGWTRDVNPLCRSCATAALNRLPASAAHTRED